MKRKNIALLVVLVLLSTMVVGAAQADDPVKLTFMCWGAAEEGTRPAFEAMVDAFNESHPDIEVEIVAEPFNNVLEQVLILNASDQTPDIMQIHSSFTAAMQGAGALANLSELMSDELVADFYPNTMEALQYGGGQYALPWSPTPVVMFYNKSLMEQAGYTEPPKTIEELKEIAGAIAALGADDDGNTIYGIGVQSKAIGMTGIHFMYYLWTFGGDVLDDDGNVVIDSEQTVNALNFVKSLMDEGISPVGLEIKDLRNLFAQGVVGFHIDGADYALNSFNALAADPEEFIKGIGVTTLPTSDVQSAAGNGFFIEHNLGIAEDCEYKAEALTFIEWLSGTEAVDIFNNTIGNKMPSRYSVAAMDYYTGGGSEFMPVFLEALSTARNLPEKNAGFNDAMVKIANAVQRVCINDEDPQVVVAELGAELEEIYGN